MEMPTETAISKKDGTDIEPRPEADDDAGRIERIVSDTKTLSEDLTEWLRLKIELLQLEVHERITEEINAVVSMIVVLSLLLMAVLLALMAVGNYLGEILGNSGYGYAVVAAFVAIVAIVIGKLQPQWITGTLRTFAPRQWLRRRATRRDQDKNDEAAKS